MGGAMGGAMPRLAASSAASMSPAAQSRRATTRLANLLNGEGGGIAGYQRGGQRLGVMAHYEDSVIDF